MSGHGSLILNLWRRQWQFLHLENFLLEKENEMLTLIQKRVKRLKKCLDANYQL